MNTTTRFAIYSPNEAAIQDGAGYWNNNMGWGDEIAATLFTKEEAEILSLPLSTGKDARWVPAEDRCPLPRIIAAFQPQVWQGRRKDTAYPVGDPIEIDVTNRVLNLPLEKIIGFKGDDTYDADGLVEGLHDHSGPFCVIVADEIVRFFELHGFDRGELTETDLVKLRAEYSEDRMEVVSRVMGFHNLSSEQWDLLSSVQQQALALTAGENFDAPAASTGDYLYYVASDEINMSTGTPGMESDDVYDLFVKENGHSPTQILGVTSDKNGSIDGVVVWEAEDDGSEDEDESEEWDGIHRCPKCDGTEGLSVVVSAWAKLTQDGPDDFQTDADADGVPDHDHEWNDDSSANCTCGWRGKVVNLKVNAEPMQIEVGSRVYWTDPDHGLASGPGTVVSIQGDGVDPIGTDTIISLKMDDGGEAEVLVHEIRPVTESSSVIRNQCEKCGGRLNSAGYCEDITCPYNSWPQHVLLDDMYKMSTADIETKYNLKKGLRTLRMVVAVTNADGEPDLFFVKMTCRQGQYDEGEHYEYAKDAAMGEGYESPMIAFDEFDSGGKAMMPLFVWETASVVDISEE